MKSFGSKRILSLLVAVCMLVAMLPASLLSASAAGVGTVYSYKFHEAVKTVSGGASFDLKTSAFATDYTASQDAGVDSAEWMLVSASNVASYSGSSADIYGIFAFGTKGGSDSITYKINVPEDGYYNATWNFYQYSSGSAPADVYLTPVGEDEVFLMNIDKTADTAARTVTASAKALAAGDYYLTVKQLGDGVIENRYFAHYSFDLEKVGEYDPEQVNFEYNFTKGYRGAHSQDAVAIDGMGYPQTMKGNANEVQFTDGKRYIETDPWAFEQLLSAGTTASVSGSFPLGTATTTIDCRGYVIVAKDNGGVSFRISVPKDGTYLLGADITKGSGYGSGTFYLAPATAEDPVASQYAITDEVSFSASALSDHTILSFGEQDLTAGEYIVSVKGVINALFWRTFTLTNPYFVKSVDFSADTLKIAVGQTATVSAVVTPSTANQDVYYTTDSDCVSVDEITGEIVGVKEGTAVITATSEADSDKFDTIIVTVTGKNFYYDFMKTNGFGLNSSSSPAIKTSPYANDFKYTTSGSPDEVGVAYESNGWKVGAVVNSGDWLWSPSAVALGLYVNVNSAAAAYGTASIHVDVPVAGTYDLISVHSLWTGGATADYYFAPVSAANPIDAQYKVNEAPVNHKDSTNHTTEAIVGNVSVPTAGEYILTFYSANKASGIFVRGIRLSDADALVPVSSITLNQAGTVALNDSTLSVTANVLPANATDKTYTLSSSDTSIATVSGGVVTPVGTGIATITATANDGSGVTASFDVLCNMELKYTYEFRDTMASMYTASTQTPVDAATNAFGVSYAKSEELNSAPWMYDTASDGNEYFSYTHSSYSGFGAFAINDKTVGKWNSIKIRVDAGAVYTPMLRISDWAASNSFDVYIAPVLAPDRVAAEYKVGSFSPSGDTVHGIQMLLDQVDMPAGEYYVTFKTTKVNGGTLIAVFDLELYQADTLVDAAALDVRVSVTDGAQVRTSDPQGLRFLSSIRNTSAFGKVVEYGTLLIPTEYLNGDNSNLVLGYKAGQKKMVGRVPAKLIYNESNTGITYTAVLTNIPTANYTTEISARAYAVYEDANGNLKVVYSSDVVSRSIYSVAQAGLNDANATDSDKLAFQAIVDAVANN